MWLGTFLNKTDQKRTKPHINEHISKARKARTQSYMQKKHNSRAAEYRLKQDTAGLHPLPEEKYRYAMTFFSSIAAYSCKPVCDSATKKCTIVQFFFGEICICAFFFVSLHAERIRIEQ